MTFHDVNGETGSGGCYGGLHFYQGGTPQVLLGNDWISTDWTVSSATATPTVTLLNPSTSIATDEWHTIVAKVMYAQDAADTITVWLDPDFTQPDIAQTSAPVAITADNSFDSIHLRCGNGTASASFSNIVFAATAQGVGFAAPVQIPPAVGGVGYDANGFHFVLTVPNGQAYTILSSTNVAAPLLTWDVVGSGTFGPSGVVAYTNGASGDTRGFYRVRSP
ncbi:MAG: hypothetical protein NT154_13505 [Verrucomicrobia bacterium]|nr:hypothetical protein [Verrucomicrobiota bacterium]